MKEVYKDLAHVRRELENVLLLVDELYERGIPRTEVLRMIDGTRKNLKSGKDIRKDATS